MGNTILHYYSCRNNFVDNHKCNTKIRGKILFSLWNCLWNSNIYLSTAAFKKNVGSNIYCKKKSFLKSRGLSSIYTKKDKFKTDKVILMIC